MDENITNQTPDSNTGTSSAEMSQTAILRLKAAEQTDTQKKQTVSLIPDTASSMPTSRPSGNSRHLFQSSGKNTTRLRLSR